MILICRVRLVALSSKNSFHSPVQSNIYLGIRKSHIEEPRLVLVTRSGVIEFKVIKNVKRVYQNEIKDGKIGIEFRTPPHQLLIIGSFENLTNFIDLLRKFMHPKFAEKMDYIPVIPAQNKLKLVTSSKFSKSNTVLNTFSLSGPMTKNLMKKLDENLRVLELSNSNITKIPKKLGEIAMQTINFEGNAITDADLSWLNEMPIRGSLEFLNLAGNKIKLFPSVLVDYSSLFSLNLRKNNINHLPGTIGELKSLRLFNISENNLRFLPASISWLKLHKIDLTYNYLTSNVLKHVPNQPRENIVPSLRLQDLAARAVKGIERRTLSSKDCPPILLDELRSSSLCICGANSTPYQPAQFYEALLMILFATTFELHPQKTEFQEAPTDNIQCKGNGTGKILLRYHFCTYTDRCEKMKHRKYQTRYSAYLLDKES